MPPIPAPPKGSSSDRGQAVRYVLNGLVATGVHYGVLSTNLQVLKVSSAGVANFCAALVGISVSFLGSRYFVFRKIGEPWLHQATKFGLLYALIAFLHGGMLYGWSDVLRLDYRIGFLMATGLQVVLSYWGNKTLVFRT